LVAFPSDILPQLELLVAVEDVAYMAEMVEEDLETTEVVDPRTEVLHECEKLDAELFERWLLVEFFLGQDVELDLAY
jgi:hypothetical protein